MKKLTLKNWKIILFSTIFLIAIGSFVVFNLNELGIAGNPQIEKLSSFFLSIGFLEKTGGGGSGLP